MGDRQHGWANGSELSNGVGPSPPHPFLQLELARKLRAHHIFTVQPMARWNRRRGGLGDGPPEDLRWLHYDLKRDRRVVAVRSAQALPLADDRSGPRRPRRQKHVTTARRPLGDDRGPSHRPRRSRLCRRHGDTALHSGECRASRATAAGRAFTAPIGVLNTASRSTVTDTASLDWSVALRPRTDRIGEGPARQRRGWARISAAHVVPRSRGRRPEPRLRRCHGRVDAWAPRFWDPATPATFQIAQKHCN